MTICSPNYVLVNWDKYEYLLIDADNTLYKLPNLQKIFKKVIDKFFSQIPLKLSEIYDNLRSLIRVKKMNYSWGTKQTWFLILSFLSKIFQDVETFRKEGTISDIVLIAEHAYNIFKNEVLGGLSPTLIGRNLQFLSKSKKIIIISEEEKSFLIEKLESLDMLEYIYAIISSSDTGVLKPDTKYFEKAVEMGVEPSKALYVDDKLENVEYVCKFVGIDSIDVEGFEKVIQKLLQ